MQNLGTYLNFPPLHCLFTMTLLLGSDEVFTRETSNVKREIDQKLANFGGFGGLGVRGFKKFQFLPQKAHVFVNPRRSEPPIGKTCRR